jgi:hypothetical protein
MSILYCIGSGESGQPERKTGIMMKNFPTGKNKGISQRKPKKYEKL